MVWLPTTVPKASLADVTAFSFARCAQAREASITDAASAATTLINVPCPPRVTRLQSDRRQRSNSRRMPASFSISHTQGSRTGHDAYRWLVLLRQNNDGRCKFGGITRLPAISEYPSQERYFS